MNIRMDPKISTGQGEGYWASKKELLGFLALLKKRQEG
jgi:hypothetical protein